MGKQKGREKGKKGLYRIDRDDKMDGKKEKKGEGNGKGERGDRKGKREVVE